MLSRKALGALMALVFIVSACGKIKEEVSQLSNDLKVQGHWLVTQSEHSSKIEKLVEKESMVLTFKDSTARFCAYRFHQGSGCFHRIKPVHQRPSAIPHRKIPTRVSSIRKLRRETGSTFSSLIKTL